MHKTHSQINNFIRCPTPPVALRETRNPMGEEPVARGGVLWNPTYPLEGRLQPDADPSHERRKVWWSVPITQSQPGARGKHNHFWSSPGGKLLLRTEKMLFNVQSHPCSKETAVSPQVLLYEWAKGTLSRPAWLRGHRAWRKESGCVSALAPPLQREPVHSAWGSPDEDLQELSPPKASHVIVRSGKKHVRGGPGLRSWSPGRCCYRI